MLSEVSSLDLEDRDYARSFSNPSPSSSDFHKAIFSQPCDCSFIPIRPVIPCTPHSRIEKKVQKIVQDHRIAPMGSVSGEIGGKISWGGEEGIQASGYASGSASDDRGNTVEATVEVNSDGSGSASASITHEEQTDS